MQPPSSAGADRTSSASTSARCPARAVVVRTRDGAELGSAVCEYPNAVIERALPATGERLAAVVGAAGPGRLSRGAAHGGARGRARRGGRPGDGSRASAPTSPRRRRCRSCATARRCASCREYRGRPHAYPKLWKHHAAQAQAERVTALAARARRAWLPRYGGRISSEWQFAKALQVLEEDPELYAAMDRWIEAADWIVWQLCGEETRNVCTAGYKGIHQDGATRPRPTSPRSTSASPASWPTSSSTRSSPLGGRAGALTARGRRVDRAARGHRRRGRQRRRPRHGARGAGDRARPDGGDHGHVDAATS